MKTCSSCSQAVEPITIKPSLKKRMLLAWLAPFLVSIALIIIPYMYYTGNALSKSSPAFFLVIVAALAAISNGIESRLIKYSCPNCQWMGRKADFIDIEKSKANEK